MVLIFGIFRQAFRIFIRFIFNYFSASSLIEKCDGERFNDDEIFLGMRNGHFVEVKLIDTSNSKHITSKNFGAFFGL